MGQIARSAKARESMWSIDQWRDELTAWGKDKFTVIDERVHTLSNEHPLLMLFGAAAVGCAAGRILSRR
jgi:hypothetical protein